MIYFIQSFYSFIQTPHSRNAEEILHSYRNAIDDCKRTFCIVLLMKDKEPQIQFFHILACVCVTCLRWVGPMINVARWHYECAYCVTSGQQ